MSVPLYYQRTQALWRWARDYPDMWGRLTEPQRWSLLMAAIRGEVKRWK